MYLDKQALHDLADGLILADREAIESCVAFVEYDSEGVWHNRARALMCRRLKHVELSVNQAARLLASILRRFESGKFSEQFQDQLRLALVLDHGATIAEARRLETDRRAFVVRQAKWVLANHSE